jgi:hypothetical protein
MIVLLTPIMLILLFLIFHWRMSCIRNPNLFVIVFVRDYLILTSLGYIYYSNIENFKSHYILKNLADQSPLYSAVLASVYFIVVFGVCFYVFRDFIFKRLININVACNYRRYILYLHKITIIMIVALTYYVISNYESILFALGGASSLKIAALRAQVTQGYDNWFWKIVLFSWIPMVGFSWMYILLKFGKIIDSRFKLVGVIAILFGFIATILGFEKARVAFYFIGLVGIYLYTGRAFGIFKWVVLITSVLMIVSVGYIITYNDKGVNVEYLLNIIPHRIFTQSVGSIVSFYLYPDVFEFKGLSGISRLLASLVNERFSSPYADMIDYMVPESKDVSGSLSSFATGEAYALFGIFGIFISPVLTSIYYAFVDATRFANMSKIFWAPLYGLFFSMPFLASSVYSFFWPVGLFYSMAPFIVIFVMSCGSRARS